MLSPAHAVAHRKVIGAGAGWLSGMSEPARTLATKPWHNDCVALGAMRNETRQRWGFAEADSCRFEAFADLRNRGCRIAGADDDISANVFGRAAFTRLSRGRAARLSVGVGRGER